MKKKIKKKEVIYFSIIGVMAVVIFLLSAAVVSTGNSGCEIDVKRAEAEIKSEVTFELSREIILFSDICYAMYSGTIGDVSRNEVEFGKKCTNTAAVKADRCVSCALETDHNLFLKTKKSVIDDISRASSCFVKPEQMPRLMQNAEEAVDKIISNVDMVDVTLSSVRKNLRRRIESDQGKSAEQSESSSDWEQTAADIAGFVSKAAIKLFF